MKLKTKRLVLRDFKKGDEESLRKNVNYLEVSRYLSVVPYPYTPKDAKWFVNNCIEESKKKPREGYELAIVLPPGKDVVGIVGLTNVHEFTGTAVMGYWLGQDYWRKGYMFEAVREMLRFAFEDLKLRRVNISVYTQNKASKALIEKLGFRYEGTKIKSDRVKSTGKIVDAHIYGMLKSEWRKLR